MRVWGLARVFGVQLPMLRVLCAKRGLNIMQERDGCLKALIEYEEFTGGTGAERKDEAKSVRGSRGAGDGHNSQQPAAGGGKKKQGYIDCEKCGSCHHRSSKCRSSGGGDGEIVGEEGVVREEREIKEEEELKEDEEESDEDDDPFECKISGRLGFCRVHRKGAESCKLTDKAAGESKDKESAAENPPAEERRKSGGAFTSVKGGKAAQKERQTEDEEDEAEMASTRRCTRRKAQDASTKKCAESDAANSRARGRKGPVKDSGEDEEDEEDAHSAFLSKLLQAQEEDVQRATLQKLQPDPGRCLVLCCTRPSQPLASLRCPYRFSSCSPRRFSPP